MLKLGEDKLHSPNANSSQVLLDNGLGQIFHSLKTLTDTICPRTENYIQRNFDCFCLRTIVSPRNDTVNDINKIIIKRIPGDFKYYKSIDTVCNIEDTVRYPQEFLNYLNPSGLPPHVLELKKRYTNHAIEKFKLSQYV